MKWKTKQNEMKQTEKNVQNLYEHDALNIETVIIRHIMLLLTYTRKKMN